MQTTYQAALDEFRDASAAVRQAFGKVSEARELQIIADSQHKAASIALGEAQARMDAADKGLAAAREVPAVEAAKPAPVFASFHDPKPAPALASEGYKPHDPECAVYRGENASECNCGLHAKPNGAVIDAQADGIGIG